MASRPKKKYKIELHSVATPNDWDRFYQLLNASDGNGSSISICVQPDGLLTINTMVRGRRITSVFPCSALEIAQWTEITS